MKVLSIYIFLFLLCGMASAQDLNATVQVLSPKVQSTNKRILQTLETAMKDFLNGRKWSQDNILPQERIECNFILNVTNWDGNSNFSGELQVLSVRPVFNSGYTSTLLNTLDKDISFSYTEGQTMDFSDQSYLGELTSILAFYADVIVGLDYDSFSRFGGTPYFAAAQTVVANAQGSSAKGWKAFDGNKNRYWLQENLNNKLYQPLRSFMYDYHRNGLDLMADNASKGKKAIFDLMPTLSQVDMQRVGGMFPLVFFTAKRDEFVSIFANADMQQKVQVINILTQVDPANGLKYQALQKQ
ncbi:type IX secretion system protein PorD [Mucilaginibacter gotjawali]|uniref:Uncharacterized protein n=2 Tax=Mucilaginibacter gotjawali TaxID=1550579 RepID=A0A110B466_9SPHI|nr:DUF4835 family protein [Mucilaginibacter gotjawali]MBB3055299.1 hypothetical protein [Mucilaginibacter gotjawali]BAU56082.1 hypothetical protein MgSA37_04279 [Mucilaginibacter gotjawali]